MTAGRPVAFIARTQPSASSTAGKVGANRKSTPASASAVAWAAW
jgi:hypothetical protein